MTQEAGLQAPVMGTLAMDTYVRKQAIGDAVVNVVLTAVINGWLTRGMASIPGSLPMGDTAPNVGGTLVGIAVLQSLLLTPIVFAVTVSQRKAGKVAPPLDPGVRTGMASARLTLIHVAVTLIAALVLGAMLKAVAPDLQLSRWGFVGLAAVISGALAWVLSRSTTRGTLRLG